jgi:hypothetical protein
MQPLAAGWREHRSAYLACPAMGWLLLFGLILRNDVYNDDLSLEADGGFCWGRWAGPSQIGCTG